MIANKIEDLFWHLFDRFDSKKSAWRLLISIDKMYCSNRVKESFFFFREKFSMFKTESNAFENSNQK